MTSSLPPALLVAAAVVAVEGLVLAGYGVAEATWVHADRLALGLTTTFFFLAYGGGLLVCARALRAHASWARGPAVFAQLLQLGIAWNLRAGATAYVALALAVVALVALTGLLHPASTRALGDPARDVGVD